MSRDGCLFCGGKPLTIEHALPIWLGKILPALGQGPAAGFAAARVDLNKPKDRQFFIKKGEKTPFEAKQPCKKCNSGWMSDLELQVKPWMMSMVKGQPVTMPDFAIRSMAAWCVKTTTFYRYTDSPPAPTPDYRNKWLFRHRIPPPGSFVFFARFESDRPGGHFIRYELDERSPDSAVANDKVHFTSILLGDLAILVVEFFSGNDLTLTVPEEWRSALVQVWPTNGKPLAWPPASSLTLAGVQHLVHIFDPPPPKRRPKPPKRRK